MFDSITWIVDNKTGYNLESILTVLEAGLDCSRSWIYMGDYTGRPKNLYWGVGAIAGKTQPLSYTD